MADAHTRACEWLKKGDHLLCPGTLLARLLAHSPGCEPVTWLVKRDMPALKKITVEVPANDLAMAQAYTGEGVTETVRAALKKLASIRAQHELLKLRGTFKFSMTSDELKYDRE